MLPAGRALLLAAVVFSISPAACGTPRDLTGGGPGGGLDPLVITTDELPDGSVSLAYSRTLSATGGDGVYTWSLAEGTLPDDLALAAAGTISGTPTAPGTWTFIVQVASGDGQIVTKQLSVDIV